MPTNHRWIVGAISTIALVGYLQSPLFSRTAMAQWGGWENLGGVILEQPECVSWDSDRIDCFARGTNRAMYHRWWNGSSWGGWENLGGVILEEPNCVSWGPNRIDCFARGTNAAMYHRWWNGSSWGGWENLGGVILEEPNCVSWGPNRIDCFARGTNRAMYHRWWNGSSWGGWENLGGVILDAPECISRGPNRIDCFARGTNHAMYHRWWNGSSWGGWENLGGVLLDAPECVSWGPNRIDCFARGMNRAMYHRWWNGSSWGGWENLGGTILERPECVSWGPNRIDCFARGTNRSMYYRWWNGSSWGGWENLGGTILERPECVSWGPNRIDCFARGTNAAMYHRWWPAGVTRRLTVSRHNTADLTNAEVDAILSDASTVLQTNDGAGDVACPVTLARSGNVSVFTTGDGTLDTPAEVSTVFNLPGNVKVVEAVDYCGGQQNTSIIGCGLTPGPSFITERFIRPDQQEGILWAHEFGHNQGLPHRNTSTNNIMYWTIGNNRRRVNQAECNAFLGQQGLVAIAAAEGTQLASSEDSMTMPGETMADKPMPGDEAAGEPMQSGAAGEPMPGNEATGEPMRGGASEEPMPGNEVSVEEFVGQIYFHGLPLDKAATYGESNIDKLLTMLRDPDSVYYHENVALTLGMIGSERAVEPLIAYIREGAGSAALESAEGAAEGVSHASYKGRVGAVMALGYIVNRSGSEQALSFLKDSTSPQVWQERNVEGLSAEGDAPAETRRRDLSKYAIISLGISGNPEALQHLKMLREQEMVGDEGAFLEDVDDVIEHSLQLNEQISQEGLLNYYKSE